MQETKNRSWIEIISKLPYPLAVQVDRLERGGGKPINDRLSDHLNALDTFVSFVSLIHIARYIPITERNLDVNDTITSFFETTDPHEKLLQAKMVASYLHHIGQSIHEGFSAFFRRIESKPIYSSSTPKEIQEYLLRQVTDAPPEFFTFEQICAVRSEIVTLSDQISNETAEIYCNAIRLFLRNHLSIPCFQECALFLEADENSSISLNGTNAIDWQITDIPRDAKIVLRGMTEREISSSTHRVATTTDLFPFVLFQRIGALNILKIFKQNNIKAACKEYTPIESIRVADTDLREPGIAALPWGGLNIHRTIQPSGAYVGDTFHITVIGKNVSDQSIKLLELDDPIPAELVDSETERLGGRLPRTLAAGEQFMFRFDVTASHAGSYAFADSAKAVYFALNEKFETRIKGDYSLEVLPILNPRLSIERQILNEMKIPINPDLPQPFNELLFVSYKIETCAVSHDGLDIRDLVTNARITDSESTVLWDKNHGSSSEHEIREAGYEIRLSEPGEVRISTQVSFPSDISFRKIRDTKLQVLPVQKPMLQMSFIRVSQKIDRYEKIVTASIKLVHTGGSAAQAIAIHPEIENDEFNNDVTVESKMDFNAISASLPNPQSGNSMEIPFEIHISNKRDKRNHAIVVLFKATYLSLNNIQYCITKALNIDLVINSSLADIHLIGRSEPVTKLASYLQNETRCSFFCLYGELGSGKNLIAKSACNIAGKMLSREVESYTLDCSKHRVFVNLLRDIVLTPIPEDMKRSHKVTEQLLDRFLRDIGINPEKSKSIRRQLLAAANSEPTASASFLNQIFNQYIHVKGIGRLVFILEHSWSFDKEEQKKLIKFLDDIQCPQVRFVVTGTEPIAEVGFGSEEVAVEKYKEKECREYIAAVFLYPVATKNFIEALIEKSERNPASLKSLIGGVLKNQRDILSLNDLGEIGIKNYGKFSRLHTSISDLITEELVSLHIHQELVAIFGLYSQPVSVEQLQKMVDNGWIFEGISDQEDVDEVLARSMDMLIRRGWVHASRNDTYEIGQRSVRTGFKNAIRLSTSKLQLIHLKLFELCSDKPAVVRFEHLISATEEAIKNNQEFFLNTLETLINAGSSTLVKQAIDRLFESDLLESTNKIRFQFMVLEFHDIHPSSYPEKANTGFEGIESEILKVKDSTVQRKLKSTLVYHRSSRAKRVESNNQKAIGIAESLIRWRIHDPVFLSPELEFKFFLNLWELYALESKYREFKKVHKKIWSYFEHSSKGHSHYHADQHEQLAVALFLKAYLRVKRKKLSYNSEVQSPANIKWNELISEENLRKRFSGDYLANPTLLNIENQLLIGEILTEVGTEYWKVKGSREKCLDVCEANGFLIDNIEEGQSKGLNVHKTYFYPAKEIFEKFDAKEDLAKIKVLIADAHKYAALRSQELLKRREGQKLLSFPDARVITLWERAIYYVDIESFRIIRNLKDQTFFNMALNMFFFSIRCRLQKSLLPEEKVLPLMREILSLLPAEHPEYNEYQSVFVDILFAYHRYAEAFRLCNRLRPYSTDHSLDNLRYYLISTLVETVPLIEIFDNDLDQMTAEIKGLRAAAKFKRFRTEFPTLLVARPENIELDILPIYIRTEQYLIDLLYKESSAQQAIDHIRGLFDFPGADAIGREGKFILDMLPVLWKTLNQTETVIRNDYASLLDCFDSKEEKLETHVEIAGRLKSTYADVRETALIFAVLHLELAEIWYVEKQFKQCAKTLELVFADFELHCSDYICAESLKLLFLIPRNIVSEEQCISMLYSLDHSFLKNGNTEKQLNFLIKCCTLLLQTYSETNDTFYITLLTELLEKLKPTRQKCTPSVSTTISIVNLYLNLPDKKDEAAELLETVCIDLIEKKQTTELSHYLSFLSDLIQIERKHSTRFERQVTQFISRMAAVESRGPDFGQEIQNIANAYKASAFQSDEYSFNEKSDHERRLTDLCIRIITCLSDFSSSFTDNMSALFNTAKLLDKLGLDDVATALYAKQYQLSYSEALSSVWQFTDSASKIQGEAFSQSDRLALMTLSNSEDENNYGELAYFGKHSIRNYLICSKARNSCLPGKRYAHSSRRSKVSPAIRSSDRDIYEYLELSRFVSIYKVLKHSVLGKIFERCSDIERNSFILFLHSHLFNVRNLSGRAATIDQKLQELLDYAKNIESEISRKEEYFSDQSGDLSKVKNEVKCQLLSLRNAGREIMEQVAFSIQYIPLQLLLEEASFFLEFNERFQYFDFLLRGIGENHISPDTKLRGEDEGRDIHQVSIERKAVSFVNRGVMASSLKDTLLFFKSAHTSFYLVGVTQFNASVISQYMRMIALLAEKGLPITAIPFTVSILELYEKNISMFDPEILSNVYTLLAFGYGEISALRHTPDERWEQAELCIDKARQYANEIVNSEFEKNISILNEQWYLYKSGRQIDIALVRKTKEILASNNDIRISRADTMLDEKSGTY